MEANSVLKGKTHLQAEPCWFHGLLRPEQPGVRQGGSSDSFPENQLLPLLLENAPKCSACSACSCQIGFSAPVPSVVIPLCCQGILTVKEYRKRNGHQKVKATSKCKEVIWPKQRQVW